LSPEFNQDMQRPTLVPSLDQVQRTLAADIAYTICRMKVLERLPGNPIGINVRWIDDTAVALMARIPAFARVVGLEAGHERHIADIASWYGAHGIMPRFEMVPGHYEAGLGRELTRLGFFQSGFQASLIGDAAETAPVEEPLTIERVTSDSMDDFLDAYVAGWGIPERDRAQFKFNVRPWLDQEGWTLYLGRSNGQPAAAAVLYLRNGVGYLADAATNPTFRGLGFQSALLRRRIRHAAEAAADFVVSGAAPFSTSHRNMERSGMRLQFMCSLWTPL
jgi:ribosomal protein S18 acetylase RimI-like enzyme